MMTKLTALVLALAYIGFAWYGFISDCINTRWGWVVAEIATGSFLAMCRGVYIFLH